MLLRVGIDPERMEDIRNMLNGSEEEEEGEVVFNTITGKKLLGFYQSFIESRQEKGLDLPAFEATTLFVFSDKFIMGATRTLDYHGHEAYATYDSATLIDYFQDVARSHQEKGFPRPQFEDVQFLFYATGKVVLQLF